MTRIERSILQSHFPFQTYIVLDTAAVCGQPKNATGRIIYINQDIGTILVDFDNGQRASLIYGIDKFHRYIEPFFQRSDLIDNSC